jgi:alginate O-acetyltransferase complex protein AlgI
MNYTNGVFILFFLVTFFLYYLLRRGESQVLLLIVASLFFYAWESPPLLLVFLTSWFITSLSSYRVLLAPDRRQATLFATVGVVTNLVLLGFFKYKFLFLHDVSALAPQPPQSLGNWLVLAPLPIGISFYTFHGISLLVDVLRGNRAFSSVRQDGLKKHLGDTLLYLVFFPQLIAGPIIKAKDFFPQVNVKAFRSIDFAACFRILVLGYFLKSVVADNLGEQTFWISYPYFQWRSSADLLVMLYGYSAQIFADFAGYSLIAIGLAGLLGYKLPDNFNFPYLASSVSDFWRRWHMSLSSWLRDYLYIPLGGSQKGMGRTYVNLIVVMLLGGLWHGAAWGFAIWGLWHGLGLVLERPLLGSRFMQSARLPIVFIRIFIVFNFVTFGWLFFKLQHSADAWLYLKTMVNSDASGLTRPVTFFIGVYGLCVLGYHLCSLFRGRLPQYGRDIAYGAMLFLIVTNAGPSTPFIYFQF